MELFSPLCRPKITLLIILLKNAFLHRFLIITATSISDLEIFSHKYVIIPDTTSRFVKKEVASFFANQ